MVVGVAASLHEPLLLVRELPRAHDTVAAVLLIPNSDLQAVSSRLESDGADVAQSQNLLV